MDIVLTQLNEPTSYEISPIKGVLTCQAFPSASLAPLVSLFPAFDSSWYHEGQSIVNGQTCDNWTMVSVEYNRTGVYNFYTSAATGDPVQLYMNGVNIIFSSHPDIYIINYNYYQENYENQTEFDTPQLCQGVNDSSTAIYFPEDHTQSYINKLFSLIDKNIQQTEDMFIQYVQKFQKKYESLEERIFRKSVWLKTHHFIEQFNREDRSYRLKMNHFGDMTDEEFKKVMLPRPPRPENNGASSYHVPSEITPPPSVDWRQKNAVTIVKDQGTCGSCWTFGTTGTLEGAWAIKYGKLIPISEQQIVDCAWMSWGGDGGTQGCNGGYAAPALQWIMDNGGIATEHSYPYLGQDGYCRAGDKSSGIQVKGYVNVTGYENGLLDAVANAGPVAVAIDASVPTYRYYESGLYYEPLCRSGLDFLDHEVLTVGYGSENGEDYWIVKNSWSTHWGMDGYIWMARNRNNNCGIASQPTYALV